MRVLYSFPHDIGSPGIGTTAVNQVLGLVERGHDVTVMATSARNKAYALPKLITTMMLGGVRVPHRVLGLDNSMAYHDLRVAAHLRSNPGRFDVVHCWPGGTLHTAKVAKAVGVPCLREVPNTHTANAYAVVGRLCDELGIELKRNNSHRLNVTRLANEEAEYQAAFRLLVPSEHVASTFLERGIAAEKLLRHQYGYDPKIFQPAADPQPGPLRAIFLGGIGPRKGLHIGLEAWRRSSASQTGRFSVYGRIEEGYEPIIAPFLNEPSVTIHDFTADTPGVLRASDVLVLPSFEEGSALVTYEAQGSGVAPLVSDAAGAMCTDQVTGLVHRIGDIDALTRHFTMLSEQPLALQRLRKAVLAGRDKLTWAAAAERLETCYGLAREALAKADARAARSPAFPAAKQAGDVAATPHSRDLIFTYWHETWTDSRRRQFMTPDRLVATLLTHEDVRGLLIADPYRMGPTQVVRRLQGRRPEPLPARPYPTGVVSPFRLRRQDGIGEKLLRRSYEAYDARVRQAAGDLGLQDPAIITTNPFYAAYGSLDWAGPVTYYGFDDWAAYDGHNRHWPDYNHAYCEIRRRGHRVCAVSQHLLNILDPTGPGLVVPNGVVPEEWQEPWSVPDWFHGLPGPTILYTGAIHSRLDLAAVRQVAERFSSGTLLFVGPIAHPEVAHRLSQIRGVQVRDPLPRHLIAGLTRSVDVCIMPHLRNPLTESMSPLKLYEYCAAGRPVATTDIAPVRDIHGHIVLVPEGGAFADGVEKALAIGPMTEDERQAFIRGNSWRGRHDAILRLALPDA
ncbi:glycosyltransferase [Phenylobacterium sp.]|jgi:glycosyltransferase involved in cell wall biosynthesis|uniref:glycosyltransferase family 4 protein n=1 Tax=Phenylobacterium sp. TaxID=1871053 RepID=UPI002E33B8EF|nr:glycosyltransferase [Phenylobacterium sp.]HEX3365465.1 glycosyltransferase [Phenylobacterium sp.]